MGLLDATRNIRHQKRCLCDHRAGIFGLIGGTVWWMLRFHTEKVTIHHFMEAVVSGKMQRAYQIWQPVASYTFNDFVREDWGPDGYYGPVKSYHIKKAEMPRGGSSSAEITLEISPYSAFSRERPDQGQQNEGNCAVGQSEESVDQFSAGLAGTIRRPRRASSTNITGISSRTG